MYQFNEEYSQEIQPAWVISNETPSTRPKVARSAKRKAATEREKKRMEKVNTCIEDIRILVCPKMKTPTKAKILREAINRLEYLEKIAQQLMHGQNSPVVEMQPEISFEAENQQIKQFENPALQTPSTQPESMIAQAFGSDYYEVVENESLPYEAYPQVPYQNHGEYQTEVYQNVTYNSEGSVSPTSSFEMISSPDSAQETTDNSLYFSDSFY